MLEESGIATVVMGCAKDIVEHVGVPRLSFSDFPLGNAAGRPKDSKSQAFTLELALKVLETAPAPRTPCSRRSCGTPTPTGSSTIATSHVSRLGSLRVGVPILTSRKVWRRACARTSISANPIPRRPLPELGFAADAASCIP